MTKSLKREKERNMNAEKKSGKRKTFIFKNASLYLMLVIPMLYFVVFKYLPLLGLSVAFKKFNIFQGMWDSPWVGLEHFKIVFSSTEFYIALKNTLILNFGQLLIEFPVPILLAILVNELVNTKMQKFTQIIMYLPHFLSMIIIAGIMYQVFSTTGIMNNLLRSWGMSPVPFLTDARIWRLVYWGSGLWMGAGYGMIIYLASLAGVNVELYDAAYIDGAGRFKRIWHVTLPQIKSTIVTLTIMNVGKILSISFERPFFMGNVAVKESSSVISTYVYSVGLQGGQYDFATAVGLFQSVVALILVLTANFVAKRLGEEGII
jgi:putative aldouronate transport system permease protein